MHTELTRALELIDEIEADLLPEPDEQAARAMVLNAREAIRVWRESEQA